MWDQHLREVELAQVWDDYNPKSNLDDIRKHWEELFSKRISEIPVGEIEWLLNAFFFKFNDSKKLYKLYDELWFSNGKKVDIKRFSEIINEVEDILLSSKELNIDKLYLKYEESFKWISWMEDKSLKNTDTKQMYLVFLRKIWFEIWYLHRPDKIIDTILWIVWIRWETTENYKEIKEYFSKNFNDIAQLLEKKDQLASKSTNEWLDDNENIQLENINIEIDQKIKEMVDEINKIRDIELKKNMKIINDSRTQW